MNKNLKIALFIVCLIAVRVLPHFPNFFPLTAIALFCGAFLNFGGILITAALLVTATFLSDLILGFHESQVAVYLALMLTVLLGSLVNNNGDTSSAKNPSKTSYIGSSLLATTMFFFITNFSVWCFSTLYEKSFTGLLTCFTVAIPFFERSLIADTIFSCVVVALYSFSTQFYFERKKAFA